MSPMRTAGAALTRREWLAAAGALALPARARSAPASPVAIAACRSYGAEMLPVLRRLFFLLSLVSQPALCQQVGNAVQKRLNSFLGSSRRIPVGMFGHGQGLQGLGLSPARPLAGYEKSAKCAKRGMDE